MITYMTEISDPIFEPTEELITLFRIRTLLELRLSVINEQTQMLKNINSSLSPFINNFYCYFQDNISTNKKSSEARMLESFLEETIKNIKAICKHKYQDDEIETYRGFSEKIQKITTCSVCYCSFSQKN
jgi:hypothetical protein